MKRKVNMVGTGTLTISLPSEWIHEHNIKKGDELNLIFNKAGGIELTVNEKDLEKERKELSSKGLNIFLNKLVAGFYKGGYDEVKIIYSSPEEINIVQWLLNVTCIGYEIVELTKESILVKAVSKIDFEEFGDIFRRIFMTLISIAHDTLDACEKADYQTLKSCIIRHTQINRYSDFCRRVINLRPGRLKRPGPVYSVIETLENVADIYRSIAEDFTRESLTISSELSVFFKKVNNYMVSLDRLYFSYDYNKMKDFILQKKTFNQEYVPINMRLAKKEIMTFYYLKSIIQRIYDLNGQIMTINA